jgi:hypothetical protein
MFTIVAIEQLKAAGYSVSVAEGVVPGLWNVEGLACDVTTGQLCDLAKQHGNPLAPFFMGPAIFDASIMS